MKSDAVLRIKNLAKNYREFSLQNVSFEIVPGEIVGLIGPNGAGKSTTLKLILKVIQADAGKIMFMGDDVTQTNHIAYKEQIGFVGENTEPFSNQSLKNIKTFYAKFYKNWDESRFKHLFFDVFELDENKKIKELSKGMKVKFSLTLALAHHPKLLILDEPTSGLDPIVRGTILKIIREYADKEQISTIFSSHITEDMHKIADRLIFLNNGEILDSCLIEDIKKKNVTVDEYLESLIQQRGYQFA